MCRIIKKKHNRKHSLRMRKYYNYAVILLCLSVIPIYGYVIQETRKMLQNIIESVSNERFELLYSFIESTYDKAYFEVQKVSTNIQNELNTMDKDSIKSDLDQTGYSEDMYECIRGNIEGKYLNNINNHRNGIIVMTMNGIYENLSLSDAPSNEEEAVLNWDFVIKNSYNQDLQREAICKITNHTGNEHDLIVVETEDITKNKDHKMIKSFSYEKLKEIYLEEGIDGLRNYNVYVPAYITEDGDIFGQKDIMHGVQQYNYKIILVQQFNIYDQLIADHEALHESLSRSNDTIETNFHYMRLMMAIVGFLFVIVSVILLFHLTSRINALEEEISNQDDIEAS